jgi:ABC-type Fe3+ transport system permease subunit
VDLSGADWSAGQVEAARTLKEAGAVNQSVLSLAHNMAQENGITAAMLDVLTEFVKNKAITPDQATKRLVHAPADGLARRSALAAALRQAPEWLVIWGPLLLAAAHIVVFAAWTVWISFTASTLMPVDDLGRARFRFDWIVVREMAIWTIVLAGVWQAAGFAMALRLAGRLAGLRSVEPDLVKAARIDGAGFFRTFFRIVLSLTPPILIVTVIWQFTHIWNEFLYGVTFTTGNQQPVTAALIGLNAAVADVPQYGVQSAAVVLVALLTLLDHLFGGKYFLRGLTAGAVK